LFHWGENYKIPQQWNNDIKRVAPEAVIHHIEGTFEDKYLRVKQILV